MTTKLLILLTILGSVPAFVVKSNTDPTPQNDILESTTKSVDFSDALLDHFEPEKVFTEEQLMELKVAAGFRPLSDRNYNPTFGNGTFSEEELRPLLNTLLPHQRVCNCSSHGCGIIVGGRRDPKYDRLCLTDGGCQKLATNMVDPKTGATNYEVITACISAAMWGPHESKAVVCAYHSGLKDVVQSHCCRDKHFCASDQLMYLKSGLHQPKIEESYMSMGWTIACVAVSAALIMCAIIAFIHIFGGGKHFKLAYARCRSVVRGKHYKSNDPMNMRLKEMEDMQHIFDDMRGGMTSGSGAGDPLMVPRTFARQITLQGGGPIGVGKFGEVWLGLWKAEPCAVKIFHSFEEKSWFREVDIYQTNMLRHANILGFIASDNVDTGTSTQLWLVTEYHANGSLYDYLTDSSLTQHGMLRMICSIANGLSFLHTSIDGTHCKPSIAHRDIKSKNILVKSDLSCCIGDLGMAVRFQNGVLDMPTGARVGTRRYLSPELLDNSLNPQQFDAFRRADIYALGLVIWEIARCTQTHNGNVYDFELPYFDMVEPDPSEEEMRVVVCDKEQRPKALSEWAADDVMTELYGIMQECWATQPTSRLTSLRVRMSTDMLAERLGTVAISQAHQQRHNDSLSVRRPTPPNPTV